MRKVVATKNEARHKLLSGLNKVADCVVCTIGPSGRNAIIERPYQSPLKTNDGVTVANEIYLDDEIEELGGQIVKYATKATNSKAGDGTTTTTVFLKTLANECFDKINRDILGEINTMEMKREIEKECDKAVSKIKEKSKKIKTKKELSDIASVSMEDREIGDIIAEVLHTVGVDGRVLTEESLEFKTSYEFVDGSNFNFGFISPIMANNDKGEAEIEKVPILVTNTKLSSIGQLLNILKILKDKQQKNLLIFTESIEKEIIPQINRLKMDTGFNLVIVKTPAGKPEILEDIVSICGGQVMDENLGKKLEETEILDTGFAQKIIVNKDETIIVKGAGNPKESIKNLKEKVKISKSEFDKEQFKKRIGNLSGVIGKINIGATTESGREYLRLKIEDAVNATRCAMEEGYIKGAGLTLLEVAEEMKDSILYNTLKSPNEQINKNAGKILEVPEWVIDPVKVVRSALENACAEVSLLITTDVAIADKKEKPKDLSFDD